MSIYWLNIIEIYKNEWFVTLIRDLLQVKATQRVDCDSRVTVAIADVNKVRSDHGVSRHTETGPATARNESLAQHQLWTLEVAFLEAEHLVCDHIGRPNVTESIHTNAVRHKEHVAAPAVDKRSVGCVHHHYGVFLDRLRDFLQIGLNIPTAFTAMKNVEQIFLLVCSDARYFAQSRLDVFGQVPFMVLSYLNLVLFKARLAYGLEEGEMNSD